MKKPTIHETGTYLHHLFGRLSHQLLLARQKELNQYNIPVRQSYILRIIKDFGEEATIYKLAQQAERKNHVISKQTTRMENNGLIKKVKSKNKSNILKLELTEKGFDMVNLTKQNKSIEEIFSSISSEERQQLDSILNKLLIKVIEYNSTHQ